MESLMQNLVFDDRIVRYFEHDSMIWFVAEDIREILIYTYEEFHRILGNVDDNDKKKLSEFADLRFSKCEAAVAALTCVNQFGVMELNRRNNKFVTGRLFNEMVKTLITKSRESVLALERRVAELERKLAETEAKAAIDEFAVIDEFIQVLYDVTDLDYHSEDVEGVEMAVEEYRSRRKQKLGD